MTSVVVYTAIIGGYDTLKPQPELPGVEYVCYTDRIDELEHVAPWTVVQVAEPDFELHHAGSGSRATAKWYKLHPHVLFPDQQTLWIDGSITIKSEYALGELINPGWGLRLYRHPLRNCIYDELLASLPLGKYGGQDVVRQCAVYRKEWHHPDYWGLWAGGIIARAPDQRVRDLFDAWWLENTTWSLQDQLSLPPLLRRLQLRPDEYANGLYDATWIDIAPHPAEV